MGVEMLKQGRETNPASHGDGMDIGEDDTEDNIVDNDISDAG
jgi:hypothetical protein